MKIHGNIRFWAAGVAMCVYFMGAAVPVKALTPLIQVPVRWCAVQGSPVVTNATDPNTGVIDRGKVDLALLNQLQIANNKNYLAGANIMFRSGLTVGPNVHFPIIPDVQRPLAGGPGQLGDIEYTPGSNLEHAVEMKNEVAACQVAYWLAAFFGHQNSYGIIAVNIRKFVLQDGKDSTALGNAPAPDPTVFGIEAPRNLDLCRAPRHLTGADIGDWVVVEDPAFIGGTGTVSHELGHALMLGHGDGLDGDSNGTLPPAPGIRDFDEYCDLRWLQGDDPLSCTSLGHAAFCCSIVFEHPDGAGCGGGPPSGITPLQAEMLRDAAFVTPGAVVPTIPTVSNQVMNLARLLNTDQSVDLLGIRWVDNAASQETILSHELFGPPLPLQSPVEITAVLPSFPEPSGISVPALWLQIPSAASGPNQFVVFADLDDNPSTGCSPSSLGFSTSFQGAELVTQVTVGVDASLVQVVTPAVWQCKNGSFVLVTDPGIHAEALTTLAASPDPSNAASLFGNVSIRIPDSIRGPMANTARIQGIAQEMNAGGQLVRLPATPDGGVEISLVAPLYPQCNVTPALAPPGAPLTVVVNGLLPSSIADVFLGAQQLSGGQTDSNGNATFQVSLPLVANQGVQSLAVVSHGTALSANCVLQVSGAPVVPVDIKPGSCQSLSSARVSWT
jgi:hypothetical protein